jgi:hypothetical protein
MTAPFSTASRRGILPVRIDARAFANTSVWKRPA